MRATRLSLTLTGALIALGLGTGAGCQRPHAWTARIVVSLSGAAGRPVHGMDVTIALPAGTRVAHEPSTDRLSASALSHGSGAPTAALDGRFVAHETAPFVRILLASREPMRDGEVAAVTATVLSAVTPPRERFEAVRVAVSGPDGATVPGATAWVSAVEVR